MKSIKLFTAGLFAVAASVVAFASDPMAVYARVETDAETARKEWADLQRVAGTGQIVSFGSRYTLHAQLRAPNDRPGHPDPYVTSIGLTKVRGNTEYAPIRALLEFRN